MDCSTQSHWDKIYTPTDVTQLGWYEPEPAPSLTLLKQCNIAQDDRILDAGSGASLFIDSLLELGHTHITAVDISAKALDALQARLGPARSAYVQCVTADLTQPIPDLPADSIKLWHDRAVLHFLTEPNQQAGYLANLKRVVRANGYVIIAAFSLSGARKCAGRDLHNYSTEMLSEFLGSEFNLADNFDYKFTMPNGDARPYVYTLFQRLSK